MAAFSYEQDESLLFPPRVKLALTATGVSSFLSASACDVPGKARGLLRAFGGKKADGRPRSAMPRSGVVADDEPEQSCQGRRLFAADDEPADVDRLYADRAKNRTAHVRSSKWRARQIDTIEIAFRERRAGKVGGAEIGLLETTT